MDVHPQIKREINLYLTQQQYVQIATMKATGINMSAVARLAIRKFGDRLPEFESDSPKAKRVLLYLDIQDYERLDDLATREGLPRSEVLRRLIGHYLLVNAQAIESLF